MSPQARPERVTAWVRGHVQGVGMRWWIRSRALELGLAGSARNLRDGRVEVVAQGPPERLDALVAALRRGEGPGRVDGVVEQRSAARPGVEGFREL